MSRRLISALVLFMLILQGVTQANAYMLPDSQVEQHCAGHDMSSSDCVCCTDEMMMAGGCASSCSAITGLPALSTFVPRTAASERHVLTVRALPGPAYLPLNPPPIR